MKLGLKSKIVSSMLVIGAVPLSLGMYFAYQQGTEQLETVIGASFEAISMEAADKIDMVVNEEIVRHAQFVSNSLLISLVRDQLAAQNARYYALDDQGVMHFLESAERRWVAGEGEVVRDITGGQVADLLRRFISSVHRDGSIGGEGGLQGGGGGSTHALFITDARGALLASINRYPNYSNAHMPWWQRAFDNGRGRVHLGDVTLDPKIDEYVIFLSTPIMDLKGTNVLGIVHRVYDASGYFEPHVYSTRFGESGHVMLVDSEGVVISCPILPTGAVVDDQELVRASTVRQAGWVKAESDGHGGDEASILGFAPLERVNRMTRTLGTRQWHTMTWQASEELFAPMNHLFLWTASAGMLAMGLLGGLGYYAASRIVTPIRKLQDSALRIAQGDLHEPILIKTGDEIEQLADGFNSMNDQLQKAFSGLEQKVEEKTREVMHLKEYNEKILMSVPDLIIIMTEDGTIEYVNRAFEELVCLKSVDVVGKNFFDVLPGNEKGIRQVREELSKLACGDGNGHRTGSIVSPSSLSPLMADPLDPSKEGPQPDRHDREVVIAQKFFQCECFRVIMPRDGTERIGLAMRDITEARNLQDELIRAEKLAGLGTLTAGIAHELNNPLFGIMGLAEIIRDGDDQENDKKHANDIVAHARHMSSVIKNFAGYVRKGETGDLVPVDINQKLDDSFKMAGMGMVSNNVQLERHYESIPPVMAKPEEIQQIFVNVIKNGIQAMEGKGLLRLSSAAENGTVIVTIHDSGPGIPKEYASRLFDPFFTTKAQGEGTGLGLTIVYKIVKKYGGDIYVDAEGKNGTKFLITFPVETTEHVA